MPTSSPWEARGMATTACSTAISRAISRPATSVARAGFGRRVRVLGQRVQGHGPPGRAEGRHLLQEEQLLVRLAEHPAQVGGGEGLEEGEIRALDGQLVIRGEPVGGQDAHDDRGGSKLARLGDEALEVTGRAGHLLQNQVHLGEPEGSEGVVVRPGGKDRAVAEDPQQASPERVVLRDEEDGSHAGTRVRVAAGTGNSMVKVQPGRPMLLRTRKMARCASAMARQMANPSPVPLVLVVTKGSKIRPKS